MSKIKLGLIGVGMAWDRLHYPAIKRLSDKFEIKAVCDINHEKAKAVACELGLLDEAVFTDYNDMLRDADIEAVDIMVPIPENYEAAKASIKSKKAFIAEKPFAGTLKGAKELVALAKKSDSKILIAENIRYDEENVLIKSLIEEQKIGDVTYFIDNNICEFPQDALSDSFASAKWRQHPDFRGGIFLDSAIHHIARHRFLFGSVQSIYAAGMPCDIDVDFVPYSCINALLTFQGNISGHYTFFSMGKETQAPLVGLRIFGTKGEIYLEDKNCGFVNISYKDGGHEAIPYKVSEGYYQELNNFYYGIRENREIVSTPEKELGDIQTIFGILDSIEKGIIVRSKADNV